MGYLKTGTFFLRSGISFFPKERCFG